MEMSTGQPGADKAGSQDGGGLGALLSFFKMFTNQGQPASNPMDSMQKMFETMSSMRRWASEMYQAPRNEVYSEVSSLLKMGLQSGLKGDKIADSLDSVIQQSAKVPSGETE
jgi:hypothetical protein